MRKGDKGKKVFGVIVILAIFVSVFGGVVSAEDVSGGLKQNVDDAEIETAGGNLSSEELANSYALDADSLHQVGSVYESSSNLGDQAATLADAVVGAPYLWGGKGWNWNPSGGWNWAGGKFVDSAAIKNGYYYYKESTGTVTWGKGLDCSGLSFRAFNKAAGATKYKDSSNPIYYEGASGQWSDMERFEQISTSIPSVSDLNTGYLLFLDTNSNGLADHVGMYVGSGYVIHSRGGVGVEKKTLNDWLNLPAPGGKYKDYFFGYGRVKAAGDDCTPKFNTGDTVEVDNYPYSCLPVRERPGTGEPQIKCESNGVVGVILDATPIPADGFCWVKVRYCDGIQGYSAQKGLKEKYIAPSTEFSIDNEVRTIAVLSVRTDPPELTYITAVPEGTIGTILDGPRYGTPEGKSGCYHWWKVQYEGYTPGWSAQDYLEKVTPCPHSCWDRSALSGNELAALVRSNFPLGGVTENDGTIESIRVTAYAIARAESGGNPSACGDIDIPAPGHMSIGLWQINTYWHQNYDRCRLFEEDYNANAAREISNNGKDWNPWCTWEKTACGGNGNEAYKQYLTEARKHFYPKVTSLSVSQTSINLGEAVKIYYSVSDDFGLDRVELLRTTDKSGNPDESNWKEVKRVSISGTTYSSYFDDSSHDSPGVYWYGIHVVDNSGAPEAWNDEKNSRTGGSPGVFGPIRVEVSLTLRTITFYKDPTNGGTLTFDGSIYSNGQSTTKTDGTYSVSANPASNYEFHHWSTTSGVSVANLYSQSTTATVSGDGSIKAWFNYIPPQRTITFYTDPTGGGTLTFDASTYSNGQSTIKTDGTYSVSANPASNYEFDHWSTTGGVSVANLYSQSTTATVSGDGSIKAWFNYIPPERTITFYTDPTAGGTLTFDGSTYSNGQSTTKTDATYSVSANPASNYAFDHWSTTGSVSVANPNSQSTTATVSGDGTIKAWFNYIPPERTITFYTDPTAGGTLTFDGSTYSNGQSTTKTDATYSVSANPASNYAFDHWSTTGGVSVANLYSQSTTATVSDAGTIKAWFNYIPPERTITFYTDPTAGGTLTFDGSTYSNGQSTTKTDATYSVSANPASNYAFDHWSTTGSVSVANPNSQSTTATVSGDGTIKAWFNYLPELSYSPEPHDFGDICEGETDSTTFEIWNSGTGTLTYSLSESCGWVEVNPTSGSSTGEHNTITVDIDTTGLSESSHTCDITISSNSDSGTFTTTVNIIPREPTLCTDPDPPSHGFGSVPERQTRDWSFDITNCGEGTLTWTVSDDQSWITVTPIFVNLKTRQNQS